MGLCFGCKRSTYTRVNTVYMHAFFCGGRQYLAGFGLTLMGKNRD